MLVGQFFLWVFTTVCSVLCKFFMHGACLKGSDCTFSHNWSDQASQVSTKRKQLPATCLNPIDRVRVIFDTWRESLLYVF
jgi:hypothetical protein